MPWVAMVMPRTGWTMVKKEEERRKRKEKEEKVITIKDARLLTSQLDTTV